MPHNISCLFALVFAVGSALITIPSQAQTAAKTNRDITTFSQSSIADVSSTSNLSNSGSSNQNKATNISLSKSEASSTTTNIEKSERRRNFVYSRIGFGLKQ